MMSLSVFVPDLGGRYLRAHRDSVMLLYYDPSRVADEVDSKYISTPNHLLRSSSKARNNQLGEKHLCG